MLELQAVELARIQAVYIFLEIITKQILPLSYQTENLKCWRSNALVEGCQEGSPIRHANHQGYRAIHAVHLRGDGDCPDSLSDDASISPSLSSVAADAD